MKLAIQEIQFLGVALGRWMSPLVALSAKIVPDKSARKPLLAQPS
jgi:hypothetical protein